MSHVMTPRPITIGRDQTLGVAQEMMRRHRIGHLPVLEHGDLVGVVSRGGIEPLWSRERRRAGAGPDDDEIDDVMSQDAYAVSPETKLLDVAREMAAHEYGCVIIMERRRVAGIFTATDALRVLAGLAPPKAGST